LLASLEKGSPKASLSKCVLAIVSLDYTKPQPRGHCNQGVGNFQSKQQHEVWVRGEGQSPHFGSCYRTQGLEAFIPATSLGPATQ